MVILSLVVADASTYTDVEDPAQVVGIHKAMIDQLSIIPGNLIFVKSMSSGCQTVLISGPIDNDSSQDRIELDQLVRENLRVKVGDTVTVRSCRDRHHGILIYVVPYEDYAAKNRNVMETVRAYFRKVSETRLPYHEGNEFRVEHMRFKVTRTIPSGYCTVMGDTKIEFGIGWWAIGGNKKQVEFVRSHVGLPLGNPTLFQNAPDPSYKFILLAGPRGVGKRRLAGVVACESGAGFISVTGQQLMRDSSGERLQSIFSKATQMAPCIIFINGVEQLSGVLLGDFMNFVDNLKQTSVSNVVVVGSTEDQAQSISCESKRDAEVEFTAPNEEERLEILCVHTQGMSLHKDVDLKEWAKRTNGWVGADIATLCGRAVLKSVWKKNKPRNAQSEKVTVDCNTVLVTAKDFEIAFTTIHPSLDSGSDIQTLIDPEEKNSTSSNELLQVLSCSLFGKTQRRRSEFPPQWQANSPDLGRALAAGTFALKVVNDVASLVQVPFLQLAAATALKIAESVQTAQSNQAGFDKLSQHSNQLLKIVQETYQIVGGDYLGLSDSMREMLNSLEATLSKALQFVEDRIKTRWIFRLLCATDDAETIEQFCQELRNKKDEFLLLQYIHTGRILSDIRTVLQEGRLNAVELPEKQTVNFQAYLW